MNRLLKIINKKISLGICVSAIFICAAVAYSISYNLAMHKFNKVVSYNYEKQQMYLKLSEVDHAIRQEYISDIDENSLIDNICNGYTEGLNYNECKYFSSDEYKEHISARDRFDKPIRSDRIGDVGYLKILSLGEDSSNFFINSFKSLQLDDVHKFIIDVRGLSEGESEQLAKLINFLLPAGDIVNSVDKNGTKSVEFKSASSGVDCNMCLVCDKSTLGLSEVLLSAMKDSGRAEIVGEKTGGKALRMKTLQLSDGSVITFPTAHYITKDGNSLYGMGVTPDIDISLDEQKAESLNDNQLDLSDDDQILAAVDSLI